MIRISVIFALLVSLLAAPSYASVFDLDEEELAVNILWNRFENLPKEKRPKVAVVLGGGGARGFAHIGVLKVFREEQIPVDLVVGTSIGSIAGAFFCAGISMSKVDALAKHMSWSQISNFNIPSLAVMFLSDKLLSNEKLVKFLNDSMGDITFDQLQTPLICVATDLNTGERILLRSGSVSFAARASSNIPGLFEPVEYKQRYLVDGGISENIPVKVAQIYKPDVIIAVPVPADITKNSTDNVYMTLMQAIYIQGQSIDQEELQNADVLIRPNVGDINAIDMEHAYQAVDKGFYAAQKSLKDIKIKIIEKTQEKYLLE
ncbi:patatin-like phospholipase family protein [Endomicrobium proavitum]|uniref:Patatin n=1 Tax=Endomicrobium proavitum TaxID=1408281 RepID=A0A0G3WKX0_9BACT|nr:patatin-like phospholipase family protein [Endomicrobium proavitum]AKL98144.1 Patatin [Endomicrobium proavitum]